MRAKFLALAILAFGASGLAQATSTYRTGFTVTEGQRALRSGNAYLDSDIPVGGFAGDWLDNKYGTASVHTRDVVSAAGAPIEYGRFGHSSDMHRTGGPAYTFGTAVAYVTAAQSDGTSASTTGFAEVGWNRLSATIDGTDGLGAGEAQAVWTRGFSLEANSSFTFAGLATFGATGDGGPLSIFSNFQSVADQSFASLTLGDLSNRVRTTLSATIDGFGALLPADIFSYATGADGFMSLTVTNRSNTALTGSFLAGSYVNVTAAGGESVSVAAPVPEPEALAMMLLGVGFVGAMARKRKAAATV